MSEAPVYEPDPRDDASYWTADVLATEQRPAVRQDGSGGPRRLWAVCPCGVQRAIDLRILCNSGHQDRPLGELKWRCTKCAGNGAHAKLTWVNVPKARQDAPGGFTSYGKPRPGSFDFATGQRRGAWD